MSSAFPILFDKSPKMFSPRSVPALLAWWKVAHPAGVNVDSAASLTAASSQYLQGDSTVGGLVNQSFSVCGWCKPTSTVANQTIICDGELGVTPFLASTFNYNIYLNHSGATLRAQFNGYDDILSAVDSITGPTFTYGTAFFWCLTYDQSTGTLGLSINAGTETTAVHTKVGTTATTAEKIRIGANLATTPGVFANGVIDEVLFYTKALSGAERTALYNGGSGLRYSSLSGSLLTGLAHAYRLNEATGTRSDSVGTDHLSTLGGTPIPITGLAEPNKKDSGDPINQFNDLSGNGFHAVQATHAQKPIYTTGGSNGKPYAQFDGTDDLAATSGNVTSPTNGLSLYGVFQCDDVLAAHVFFGRYSGTNLFQFRANSGGAAGSQTASIIGETDSAGALTDSQGSLTVTNTNYYSAAISSDTTDPMVVQIWANGTSGGSTASGAGQTFKPAATAWVLGDRGTGGGTSDRFKGKWYEGFGYNAVHATAIRNRLEMYLKRGYAL